MERLLGNPPVSSFSILFSCYASVKKEDNGFLLGIPVSLHDILRNRELQLLYKVIPLLLTTANLTFSNLSSYVQHAFLNSLNLRFHNLFKTLNQRITHNKRLIFCMIRSLHGHDEFVIEWMNPSAFRLRSRILKP